VNFKNISLKKAYTSDADDVLQDFYIPALTESIEYRRLAGFFSSSSLAIAGRGIAGLISNGGIMKLVASPKFQRQDLDMLAESHEDPEKFMAEKMLCDLERLENELIEDHVRALGWMVATKRLEIRVAILQDEYGNLMSYEEGERGGIFHQKVGILKDAQGNTLSFSGSVNESAAGWFENIEEFKVFRDWELSEREYVEADISKFDGFWNNQSKRVRVVQIPHAIEEKLIKIAPDDIEKLNLDKWYRRYLPSTATPIQLFQHQNEAVEAWAKNEMKGILEMATGTGKTFAALGCLKKASGAYRRLLVVITCPYQHLIQQWKREIEKFGIDFDCLIADSSNLRWKRDLADKLVDISLGYESNFIVLTTHRTFSSKSFQKILKESKNVCELLIADEVHGLGAEKGRQGLADEYELRLGLSATPKRWFDSVGTETIYRYFGDIVCEFGLREATTRINPDTGRTYLSPFRYLPRFIYLTADELGEYVEKTRYIVSRLTRTKSEVERDEILEHLLFRRADIIKNAVEKYRVLEEILDKIGPNIKWTIIYCSSQQIDKVMEILNKRNMIVHRFTMEEGTSPEKRYKGLSERDFILKNFVEARYQALVAMKCLDEGVDVPSARIAILLASSGNPREYVQRIGRVIRRYPGKSEAVIYDLVVIPSSGDLPKELRDAERKVFDKELRRYEEIAGIAINNAEALKMVYDLREKWYGGKR